MGSTKDKIAGLANKAAGNIKQGIGKVVGSDKLRVEGKVQEIKGEGQRTVGAAKEKAKETANKSADYLNKKL